RPNAKKELARTVLTSALDGQFDCRKQPQAGGVWTDPARQCAPKEALRSSTKGSQNRAIGFVSQKILIRVDRRSSAVLSARNNAISGIRPNHRSAQTTGARIPSPPSLRNQNQKPEIGFAPQNGIRPVTSAD